MHEHVLTDVIILMATAVFIVSILKKFKLSPILGYLCAGAVIGDYGFKIVTFDQTRLLGELGVAFLLFAIGLELSLERLKAMRKYIFGLGFLQVAITGIIIASTVIITGSNNNVAIIIGGGLALSSTAIVMQVVERSSAQSTQVGRIALAILILQDFIVIPLLVIIPLLTEDSETSLSIALGAALLKAVIASSIIFIVGRLFLKPLFELISSDNNNELSIATTLLIVLSAAFSTEYFGLSFAFGAFIAGILVAETEFRPQAEKSIYPFKNLLLGLFFMTVGMKIDAIEVYQQILYIITFSISLILVKAFIITGLCILFGFNIGIALHSGLLLSQGGEFAFILFGLGKEQGILAESTTNILLLIVTCSMALTPSLALIGQAIVKKIDQRLKLRLTHKKGIIGLQ